MLEAVGITGTAARVYAELVETDQLSAEQVAQRCAISVRQAAAELRSIASLGLAFRVSGRPVRYRAVAPDLGISTLIAQREEELRDARATMHRLASVFQEASRVRHPDTHVEVVHGTPNIARLSVRVHEQTQHQLRGFDRPPYSHEPGTNYRLEGSRLAVGVAYRVIYDSAALAIPGRMTDDILPSSAAGEQARTRPELPIKMLVSDEQFALIPAAVTARSIETTFVIHRSPILDALIALFEAEWAKATPIPGTSPAPSTSTPDAETAALLAMLAAGMTDASIARSLSWSMRTAQRRMRQLMTDLGVTSRFQAGVAAREKGWL
ncbi:MAG: transcriptional regulator [Actinomycetia bacterium]|nr:transcriptional regulator [Actinomycetes bacterium]